MRLISLLNLKNKLEEYYYVRKLGEGKHTMLVLNAVRNNGAARAADSPGLRGGSSGWKIWQKLCASPCLTHRNRCGKTRVSHQARKRLKSLIHMGTMSAIQVKGDLQDYYVRKLDQGKHTMLVLNAVRNNRAARAADSPGLCGGSAGWEIWQKL